MQEKNRLSGDYRGNVKLLDSILRPQKNFDIIKKPLVVGNGELMLYFIDGFVKDAVMQKLMMHLVSLEGLGADSKGKTADWEESAPMGQRVAAFIHAHLPYVETEATSDLDNMIQMMM